MKTKDYRGITLIALIITIIVLLILAGVSISMVVGDDGILSQAVNATTATDVAGTKEQIEVALVGYLDENGEYSKTNVVSAVQDVLGDGANITENEDGTYTVTTEKENVVDLTDLINGANGKDPISKEESFVGYYADVDGDGSVDGIIYADLCIGGSGELGSNGYGTYSYDAIDSSNCKEYYISQESYGVYADSYRTNGVIRAMSGTSGKDRFYVMALEDFDSDYHCWYYSAYGNLSSIYSVSTSTNDFGEGLTNTTRMITSWNAEDYGTQNGISTYTDLWGIIQDEYADGWFVPSKSEWSCFGDVFGITSSNYSDFGLQFSYWLSSQYDSTRAYLINFSSDGNIIYTIVYFYRNVRLSTTF